MDNYLEMKGQLLMRFPNEYVSFVCFDKSSEIHTKPLTDEESIYVIFNFEISFKVYKKPNKEFITYADVIDEFLCSQYDQVRHEYGHITLYDLDIKKRKQIRVFPSAEINCDEWKTNCYMKMKFGKYNEKYYSECTLPYKVLKELILSRNQIDNPKCAYCNEEITRSDLKHKLICRLETKIPDHYVTHESRIYCGKCVSTDDQIQSKMVNILN